MTRRRDSAETGVGVTRTLYSAGFDVSWEVDVFAGSNVLGVPFVFDSAIVVIAFVFSAAVGVIFGYFAARKAARPDPIPCADARTARGSLAAFATIGYLRNRRQR